MINEYTISLEIPPNSESNPAALWRLIKLLGNELPELPPQPRFKKYKKKMSYQEYVNKILNPWKLKSKDFDRALGKYCVGTYKEWEGDGYYNSPLYKYGENYFG